MKLKTIYEQILTETVEREKLINAIEKKQVITIYYAGENTVHKGYRMIEPHCLGVNEYGNTVLRAWQLRGSTDTPNGKPGDPLTRHPGWRMFRVDGIKSIAISYDKFSEPRPKYNPDDADMEKIIKAADFSVPTDTKQSSFTPTPKVGATTTPEPEKKSMFNNFVDKFKKYINYKR